MTVMAGIFARDHEYPVPDSACESIRNVISRNTNDEVVSFRNRRIFFAKIDIGAYRQPAFRVDPSGSVAMLAGEPLLQLAQNNPLRTRTNDLELLHQEWDREQWSLLRAVRGVFCAAHYCPTPERLTLVADKLGLRTLYYWEGTRFI